MIPSLSLNFLNIILSSIPHVHDIILQRLQLVGDKSMQILADLPMSSREAASNMSCNRTLWCRTDNPVRVVSGTR